MPIKIPTAKNLNSHYHNFSKKYLMNALTSKKLFQPDSNETRSVHLISSISSIIIQIRGPFKKFEEKMRFYKNAFYGLILLEYEEASNREYKLDLKTIFHIDGTLQDPEAQDCLRSLDELLNTEVAAYIAPYKLDLALLKERVAKLLLQPMKPDIKPIKIQLVDLEKQEYDNIPLLGEEFVENEDELFVVLSDGSPPKEASGTELPNRCSIY